MKAKTLKSVLLAATLATTVSAGTALAQNGYGPSRQPRQDNKYGNLTNPDALQNVFIPKEPMAAINEFLVDMNGEGGETLVGQFFLADESYGKIVQTPEEAGDQPAGQIFYFITDTTLPNSPICSSGRGKVYMINSGTIFGDLGLIWSLITDRTQLNEGYFPKGAQTLGRPYSMKDFMGHMTTNYINDKELDPRKPADRERLVDMAILGALVDSIKSRISGSESKFKEAQEVLSQACTNDQVLIRQVNAMINAPEYLKIEDREIAIIENAAIPAAASLPQFAPMSEIIEQIKSNLGLNQTPVQLDGWITSDGKVHFKTQPAQFQMASQFWLIQPKDLSLDFTQCQHLNYTFLLDPFTEDPQQTGFMVKTSRIDLHKIATSSSGQSMAIPVLLKDFVDAAKISEMTGANGTVTLQSAEQLQSLDAYLLFQMVANIKIALLQGDAGKVNTLKAHAKNLCNPQMVEQVRKTFTNTTYLVNAGNTLSAPPRSSAN